MALFKRRVSMLEVQNRALINTARERSERIDVLERELLAARQRSARIDELERELLLAARQRSARIDELERELLAAREGAEQTDKLERELERLTLERDFYSSRVLALEEQNRELTESATKYSSWGQKLERELTEAVTKHQKLERDLTESATKYSLWGQKLERELNTIDPDGAPRRRFGAEREE
jgi:hypothetical protein